MAKVKQVNRFAGSKELYYGMDEITYKFNFWLMNTSRTASEGEVDLTETGVVKKYDFISKSDKYSLPRGTMGIVKLLGGTLSSDFKNRLFFSFPSEESVNSFMKFAKESGCDVFYQS